MGIVPIQPMPNIEVRRECYIVKGSRCIDCPLGFGKLYPIPLDYSVSPTNSLLEIVQQLGICEPCGIVIVQVGSELGNQ